MPHVITFNNLESNERLNYHECCFRLTILYQDGRSEWVSLFTNRESWASIIIAIFVSLSDYTGAHDSEQCKITIQRRG
jgi:hypothetical protein